jgi:carboxylesterase 2/para-nitrobenzyl esterase
MRRRDFFAGSAGALLGVTALSRAGAAGDAGGPLVTTAAGTVQGSTVDAIHVFKGVPFAAPPFGAHHLRQAVPPAPWSGIRLATAFGPKPPQQAMPPMVSEILPELVGPGEDCLTLNIWSAALGDARQPVMVWIAGGLFEYHGTGASPWYDGSRFARDGIVCVTINYRVGAEGFLYLGDDTANLGLLDQIAALAWLRDNVAAFGGDPDNVTIFGESAGALSIATLLAMPRARGLFRRAIVQSGGAQHVSTAATAERIGRRLAEKLGVAPTRAAVAALPAARLLAAQGELRAELAANPDPAFWGEVALTNLPWQPVVDGKVLPERPIDAIARGAGADIDLLAGSNHDEWRLFLVAEGSIDHIPPQALAATMAGLGLPVEPALEDYRERYPGAGTGDLLAAVMSDWYFRLPTLRLAEAHIAGAGNGRTFMYDFAWRSPRFGAGHSVEIPFVFDNLDRATAPLLGTAPPRSLAEAMHGAWVAFARTGDPGWQNYDTVKRATMRFDTAAALVFDPLARERALWADRR